MLRNFRFDYDPENDSLFMYDPNSKSKASIEMDDLIVDFNAKKEISGIELLQATAFLKDLSEQAAVDKSMLSDIKECKVEIITKNNFFIIKFLLLFGSHSQLMTPIVVPTMSDPSPALMES
jgi:uncharacterized protein YuzE